MKDKKDENVHNATYLFVLQVLVINNKESVSLLIVLQGLKHLGNT